MVDVQEVVHVAQQIERLHGGGRYEDMEPLLRRVWELPLTVEHLQRTAVVPVLYRVLKTCPVAAVRKEARCLLSKWKKLYKKYNDLIPSSVEPEEAQGSVLLVGCADSSDNDFPDSNHEPSLEDPEGENALPDGNSKPFSNEARGESGSSSRLSARGADPSTLFASPEEEVCSPDGTTFEESNVCEQCKCNLVDEPNQKHTGTEGVKGSSVARFGDDSRECIPLTSPEQHSQEPSSVLKVNTVAPAWHSKDASSLRSKCSELIIQALSQTRADNSVIAVSVATVKELAYAIEEHIFTLHSGNERKYKSCLRSKVSNLRNAKSPHLRQGLLSGELSAERFAQMSSTEMASKELQQLRAQYTELGISQHQLPQTAEGMPTRKVRCKRCEGFDCSVTRIPRGTLFLPGWVRSGSPNEEMTFLTCNGCGQQWYHSGWVCL